MKKRVFCWRLVVPSLLTAIVWLAVASPALAQVGPEEAAPKASATVWVLGYTLVFLTVGLGLLVVLRPSFRRERAKPERFEE
jgi:tellurite resistance protein TehA-like permease